MILTRYLYPKHNVEFSLCVSLFKKDTEQAKFWAYEMYYSGYKKQTIDRLVELYQEFYSEEVCKAKVVGFLEKKRGEWTEDNTKEATVGTMIENIVRRQPNFCKIYDKWGIMEEKQQNVQVFVEEKRILYVVLKEEAIRKYKTPLIKPAKGWMLPRKVCLYPCYRLPGARIPQVEDWRDLWIYLIAECPVWQTRIKKFGGVVDHPRREVCFVNEDYEEQFHNLYDMEPDEQPVSVMEKWLGIEV